MHKMLFSKFVDQRLQFICIMCKCVVIIKAIHLNAVQSQVVIRIHSYKFQDPFIFTLSVYVVHTAFRSTNTWKCSIERITALCNIQTHTQTERHREREREREREIHKHTHTHKVLTMRIHFRHPIECVRNCIKAFTECLKFSFNLHCIYWHITWLCCVSSVPKTIGIPIKPHWHRRPQSAASS